MDFKRDCPQAVWDKLNAFLCFTEKYEERMSRSVEIYRTLQESDLNQYQLEFVMKGMDRRLLRDVRQVNLLGEVKFFARSERASRDVAWAWLRITSRVFRKVRVRVRYTQTIYPGAPFT